MDLSTTPRTVDALFESECSGSIPWNLGAFDGLPARRDPEPVADGKADEIAATRRAVAEIQRIPSWAGSPAAFAHLLSVISAEIAKSGWGHTERAQRVCNELNDLHDDLEAA